MRKRARILLAIGVVAAAVFMNGCLFNILQTAMTLGEGNAALTIGTGLLHFEIEEDNSWSLTPQGRIGFGISDTIDIGLQTGAFIPLSTGDPGWLGAKADLKFLLTGPDSDIALALGFGGGYGMEFLGWAGFLEVFIDSRLEGFPVFFAYQPTIPFGADGFTVWHHLAGGLRLVLSPTARLLIVFDTRFPGDLFLTSFGFGFEIDL